MLFFFKHYSSGNWKVLLPPLLPDFFFFFFSQLLEYLYSLDHLKRAGLQSPKKVKPAPEWRIEVKYFGSASSGFIIHVFQVPFLWHWAELGFGFVCFFVKLHQALPSISGSQMAYFYPFLFWKIPLLSFFLPTSQLPYNRVVQKLHIRDSVM